MTGTPFPIPQRTLIAAAGADALSLLQRLVTADLALLEAGGGAIYTLLLTPQGRLRADFFAVRQGDGLWLDVPTEQAKDLIAALRQYRLRSDATFSVVPDVRVVLGGVAEAGLPAFVDPRAAPLGQRVWQQGLALEDDGQYAARRIALGLVEPALDCEPNALPLDYGLQNAISFSKGCYLGQELTARTQNRGLAKHEVVLLPLVAERGQTVMIGDKPVGRVIAAAEGQALLQLRRDRGNGPLTLVR